MLQLVAGLTVVFAGYVLYEVFKTVSQSTTKPPATGPVPEAAELKNDGKGQPAAESGPKPVPEHAAEPATEQVAVAAPDAVASAPVAEGKVVTLLRNPATGETCAVPTNYRFAKKWVKDALVAESLLDKVYKTADLDEAGSQKVREALERFKALEKYHG